MTLADALKAAWGEKEAKAFSKLCTERGQDWEMCVLLQLKRTARVQGLDEWAGVEESK